MRSPGRPSEPVLSRDAIVVAALELIEHRGYAHFSVNELAHRLGVTAGAIRHRAGSRAQLLASSADAVVAEIQMPSPGGLDWDDWLRLVATSVRGRLVDRPALIPLVLDYWAYAPRGAQLVTATLDVLLDVAGRNIAVAVTAHNVFWAFIAGTVYAQSRPATADPIPALDDLRDVSTSLERLRDGYGAAYPGADALDVAFSDALDVTLLGVRAALDRGRVVFPEARS